MGEGPASEAVTRQHVVLLGIARSHEPLGQPGGGQPGDRIAVLGARQDLLDQPRGHVVDVVGEDVEDPALAADLVGGQGRLAPPASVIKMPGRI